MSVLSKEHFDQAISTLTDVSAGEYRHYKGNNYRVIGIARHSETLEELVVYEALYGDHQLWVRPKAMFMEMVEWEGKEQSCFARM